MVATVDDEDFAIEPDLIEPDTLQQDTSAGSGATGTYNVGAGIHSRGTLDESVLETLKRDILDINSTLRKVVYPHFPSKSLLAVPTSDDEEGGNSASLAIEGHCDMWAPLTFIILYSLFVSHANSLFSSLFVICWTVLLAMASHLRLTKPHVHIALVSYISMSGYCLFPLVIQALLSQVILSLIFKAVNDNAWMVRLMTVLRLVFLAFTSVWSTTSISIVTNSKGFIQIFPLALCLGGLGWLATIM